MKTVELREKSVDDLVKLLDEKQLEAFRLRMAKSTGQLSKTHEVAVNRKLIAKLKTLINEKLSNENTISGDA